MKRIFIYCLLLSLFSLGLLMKKEVLHRPQLVIGFGGDTMLGRGVSQWLMQMQPPQRYTYPWGDLLPILQANDGNILNLETTFTRSDKKVAKVFNFKADPDLGKTLSTGNITVVSLANNHILDFALEGMQETFKLLDDFSIQHVGAGMNSEQARRPALIKKNGITIAVFAYTDNEPSWLATKDKPGINYIPIGDRAYVKEDIQKVRDTVDVIVVSLHWGPNKRERPSEQFVSFAHALIDAGVDIIHGHSAHLFQGIEIYNNKLIMYDTGDFVDDYAIYPDVRNDVSFLFQVTLTKEGPQKVHLIPTVIQNYQVNQARRIDYEYAIQRMRMLSSEFNTTINDDNTIEIASSYSVY